MLQGTPRAATAAKRLRRELSLPEVLLWLRLKGRPAGLKFRKQHPAGKFVLDFYCHEARIAIEIDGLAHDMGERPERDMLRDEWLRTAGLTVVRVAAAEVLRDPDGVAGSLVALCAEHSRRH